MQLHRRWSRGRASGWLVVVIALAAGIGLGAVAAVEIRQASFMLGGIQVNEPDLARWIAGLRAEGMNTVSVTDYAHQGDWDSSNLWWDDDHSGIVREIRAAKAGGLRVVLILRVALDHAFPRNRFLWHGMIMPTSDDDLTEWFRRYRTFAVEWARIARAEGVDVLMIGSEMNALASTVPVGEIPVLEQYFLSDESQARRREDLLSFGERLQPRHLWVRYGDGYEDLDSYLDDRIATEKQWATTVSAAGEEDSLGVLNRRRARLDREWRRLAEEVGEVFDGPLGFASNFDQYHEVGFWDALDLMGINAYFALREGRPEEGASEERLVGTLRSGWRQILADVRSVREARGVAQMPVVFTELGYTRRTRSTIRPWAGAGFFVLESAEEKELVVWEDEAADLTERALAVRALYEAHSEGAPLLSGLLYWKLSTVASHVEIEPFVVLLDQPGDRDPMLPELSRFVAARSSTPTPATVAR